MVLQKIKGVEETGEHAMWALVLLLEYGINIINNKRFGFRNVAGHVNFFKCKTMMILMFLED
jgi:hypothetical protein